MGARAKKEHLNGRILDKKEEGKSRGTRKAARARSSYKGNGNKKQEMKKQ